MTIAGEINQIVTAFLEKNTLQGELIVADETKTLFHKAFNSSDAPFKCRLGSQYLIGSITKQFTAVVFIKSLLEAFPAPKNQKLEEHFKTLIRKPLYFFFNEEHAIWAGKMPQWAEHVSPHHLLTHTSGILKVSEKTLSTEVIDRPGKEFRYLNPGFVFLGRAAEHLSQQPMTQCVETLFDLAEMHDTALPTSGDTHSITKEERFSKLVAGFDVTLKQNGGVQLAQPIDFSLLSHSGGMISTVSDLIRWQKSLFKGDVIPLEIVNLIASAYCERSKNEYYDGEGKLFSGYGINVLQHSEGEKCYQHLGEVPGYHGQLVFFPQQRLSLCHLSNYCYEGLLGGVSTAQRYKLQRKMHFLGLAQEIKREIFH